LHLRRLRPILLAETAFSLSHGLAFALTATGVVRVPAAPVEAAIALSLVLLALDTGRASGPSPRATAWLALGFGAVHGLGFAGGLRELGVPDEQVAPAVLGFGLGVELGQLAFVLLGWAALRAVHALVPPPPALGVEPRSPTSDRRATALRWTGVRLQQALVVVAGSLAMAWLLQRSAAALLRG
jgi:HupE / UreJ protein